MTGSRRGRVGNTAPINGGAVNVLAAGALTLKVVTA